MSLYNSKLGSYRMVACSPVSVRTLSIDSDCCVKQPEHRLFIGVDVAHTVNSNFLVVLDLGCHVLMWTHTPYFLPELNVLWIEIWDISWINNLKEDFIDVCGAWRQVLEELWATEDESAKFSFPGADTFICLHNVWCSFLKPNSQL